MEKPIKMDDLAVPLFSETSKSEKQHFAHINYFNYRRAKKKSHAWQESATWPKDVYEGFQK